MTIARSSPDVGYFAPEIYAQVNFSQTVRVGHVVHFSGVVAADAAAQCTSPGDFGVQLRAILGIYGKLLAHEAMTLANLVSVTIYTTDMAALLAHAAVFKEAFGNDPPAATWVEVKGLSHADYVIEIAAIAAD